MGSPYANKNAEKWPEDRALKFFKASLKLLKEDEAICFIGKLASDMNSYKTIYSYLHDKFKDINFVFVTIKKEIDTIIEQRLFERGFVDGATMAIFGLKNNHGWKDNRELTVKDEGETEQSLDIRISKLLRKSGVGEPSDTEEED